MRAIIVAGVFAILISGAMTMAGCSTPPPTEREITVPGGGGFKEKYENPKTWTVNVPAGTCWRITWTNSEGEVVHTECGNGPEAGQSPSGFTNSDFAVIPCEECTGSDLGGDPWPHGAFPYVIGTVPDDWTVSQDPFVVVTAAALTFEGASNKLHTVAENGPGSALPNATEVEAYMMITVDASGVTLHSALAQRFATYTITLDGQVIADKATGLNITATSLPEGWVSVASAIPALPAGSTIVVTQRRLGSTENVVATLKF